MVYRRIVRGVVRDAFEQLNRGNIGGLTDKLAADARHYFIGAHALGGRRSRPGSIRRWYERLFQLFPDIRFTVHRVDVAGPPWRTLACAYWTETNTGTDGVRNDNEGVNVIEIRWGKVRRVDIYTDVARLGGTLARLARAGNAAASAPAIVDPD